MIDIHCHILPSVDDGAQTLEESLDMARMAVLDGITDIVATPHTMDGVYQNDRMDVMAKVEQLQAVLDQEEIPLRIHPGAEVHVHMEFIDNLISYNSLTLCDGKRYVLLELPVQNIPLFTSDLIYELKIEGITPIIAHPERNAVLRESPNVLYEWIEQGAIAQLTADSLLGRMGERAKKTAEYLVEHHLVHVMASDAHNVRNRKPNLSGAYHALRSLSSPEIEGLFRRNAVSILQGQECEIPHPIQTKRKKRFIFF